nr:uncharacterized protein LOC107281996 [Oryza sativa Japonica Group]
MVAHQAVRFLFAKYEFAVHDYNLQTLLLYRQIAASAVDAALTASTHLARFRARYGPMDLSFLVFGLCLPPFLSSNLPSLGFSLYTMSGSSSQRVQRARESRTRRRASIGQGFLQAPVFSNVSPTAPRLTTVLPGLSGSIPSVPKPALSLPTISDVGVESQTGSIGSTSCPVHDSQPAPSRKRTLLDVPRHAATANRERRRLKRAGGDSGHLLQKILDGPVPTLDDVLPLPKDYIASLKD